MTAPVHPGTAHSASPPVHSEELTIDGRSVVVHRCGKGAPVGYLHGMIGTPPDAPILAASAKAGLAVTAPCLPGFTGSEPHPAKRSIHDWVFHLSTIVDEAGITGLPLVASSIGAMVALELAAVRPEAFSHLVLLAPLGLWHDEEPIADPFAATLSVQRRMLTADATATAPFFDDPENLTGDDLIEHGVARYETRTAAAALVWPIPDHGLAERAHRITTPITLVQGAEDQIMPPGYQDRWCAVLPNVVGSHTVADAGHLVDWDRPEAVSALVTGVATGQDLTDKDLTDTDRRGSIDDGQAEKHG